MKYFIYLILPLFATGCMTVPGKAAGFLYTKSKHGEQATSNKQGRRTGKACQTSILGLVATGDASIATAQKAGSISEITSVDAETSNMLGLYGKYCTVVRGN
jgi:hypothetical protein